MNKNFLDRFDNFCKSFAPLGNLNRTLTINIANTGSSQGSYVVFLANLYGYGNNAGNSTSTQQDKFTVTNATSTLMILQNQTFFTVRATETILLTAPVGGGIWSSSSPGNATVVGGLVTGVAAGAVIISYTVGLTVYSFYGGVTIALATQPTIAQSMEVNINANLADVTATITNPGVDPFFYVTANAVGGGFTYSGLINLVESDVTPNVSITTTITQSSHSQVKRDMTTNGFVTLQGKYISNNTNNYSNDITYAYNEYTGAVEQQIISPLNYFEPENKQNILRIPDFDGLEFDGDYGLIGNIEGNSTITILLTIKDKVNVTNVLTGDPLVVKGKLPPPTGTKPLQIKI